MAQNRFYSSTTKRTTTTADPGSSGTTLTVTDSTVFSSLDGSFPWTALINWGQSDQELVNVTARPDGTHLSIQRGQDGTTGQAHAVGATVDHGVSARDFTEAGAHVGASSGVHGVAGNVVGTTDAQTLTGKTLAGVMAGYVTKTSSYTLTTTDYVVAADATSAAFTLTLPTAVGVAGQIYVLKKIDSGTNTVTVATTSTQTIDGASSIVLRTPHLAITVISDGTNWQILDVTSADPWHSMTLQNGWGNASGGQPAEYRAIGLNLIKVGGYISGGTVTDSTTIAQLAVGYRMLNVTNSASQPIYTAGGTISQPPAIWLDSSGNLKIFHVPSTVTQIQFNIEFATDA